MQNNSTVLVESTLRALRAVLAGATLRERETLGLKSPLAWRIGDATFSAIPHASIGEDAKLAALLVAAANFPNINDDPDMDVALTIAARCLLWRAFEMESDEPADALARVDVFIALVEGHYLEDQAELMVHLRKLRRDLARFLNISAVSTASVEVLGRRAPDRVRQTVFEIVTGGRDKDDGGQRRD